jgi:hypothetical protein
MSHRELWAAEASCPLKKLGLGWAPFEKELIPAAVLKKLRFFAFPEFPEYFQLVSAADCQHIAVASYNSVRQPHTEILLRSACKPQSRVNLPIICVHGCRAALLL